MSDSIEILFKINHIKKKEEWPFRYKIYGSNSEYDDKYIYPSQYNLCSFLTEAGFKIEAVFDTNEIDINKNKINKNIGKKLIGYLIKINIPACVIGNNYIVQNQVYYSCIISFLFLKIFLIHNNVSKESVKKISIKKSIIKSVDLTYLIHVDNPENIKSELEKYALINLDYRDSLKSVRSYSSNKDKTVYFGESGLEVRLYIKNKKNKKSFEYFYSEDYKNAIYSESAKYLRMEIILKQRYLELLKLEKPYNWNPCNWKKLKDYKLKDYNKFKNYTLYRYFYNYVIDELLKSYNDNLKNLRKRKPRPQDIKRSKVKKTIKEVLSLHFEGKSYKEHPKIKGKQISSGRLSQIKSEVLEKFRIDLNIPWEDQKKKYPDFKKILDWENVYKELPKDLENLEVFCFTEITAILKIKELQRYLVNSISSSDEDEDETSNIDYPPQGAGTFI